MNEELVAEVNAMNEQIEIDFDHTKDDIFEAVGLDRETGKKYFSKCADKFNQFSFESNSRTELIEYIVNLPKNELTAVIYGILSTSAAVKTEAKLAMMMAGLAKGGMGQPPCESPDCHHHDDDE